MSREDYINEMKRDLGYGRCEDVPEEIQQMMLNGEEEEDEDELPFL